MGWHRELLIGFDLETTGTDPHTARIVTAAVIEVRDGQPLGRKEWLADPGVEIPADAVAVHGISNERAAAEGLPADRVADAVADVLTGYWKAGVPVVAYNASFDLTLLSAELRRYDLPSLRDRLAGQAPAPVIDPYTIDRRADRYRRGKRTLEAVCTEYGVALDSAHSAYHSIWRRTSRTSCAARAMRRRWWTGPGRCGSRPPRRPAELPAARKPQNGYQRTVGSPSRSDATRRSNSARALGLAGACCATQAQLAVSRAPRSTAQPSHSRTSQP
jgi:DNA polymerase-3 subunit epsilon